MLRTKGFGLVALIFTIVLITGSYGSVLNDPLDLDGRKDDTLNRPEFPEAMVPFPAADGISLPRYDMEMSYDMAVAMPVPSPYSATLMYIPLPEVPADGPYDGGPIRMDVLFCLDTTGSMGDEIYVAKSTILDIVDAVGEGTPAPEVRYGLVLYRDLEDDYVTMVYDFMTAEDLATILKAVTADGGGDTPESVSEALERSVMDVSWDLEEAACAIYLIGDAPPHTDYDNGYDHIRAAEMAAEMGIVINAIGCSGIQGHEKEFNQVVDLTGGEFVYLKYNGGGGGGGAMADCEGSSAGWFSWLWFWDVSPDRSSDGSSKSAGTDGEDPNDLDDVLTRMIRSQAEEEGVEYDE